MIIKEDIAPYVSKGDKVILFDGVCKLCSAWSRFIIKYDTAHIFRLASVQSREGQSILKHFDLPTDYFETMLYVEECVAYEKSDALFKVLIQLPRPLCWLACGAIFPKPARNWVYDRIALNRYQLFGKYQQCLLPHPDHETRFLS